MVSSLTDEVQPLLNLKQRMHISPTKRVSSLKSGEHNQKPFSKEVTKKLNKYAKRKDHNKEEDRSGGPSLKFHSPQAYIPCNPLDTQNTFYSSGQQRWSFLEDAPHFYIVFKNV